MRSLKRAAHLLSPPVDWRNCEGAPKFNVVTAWDTEDGHGCTRRCLLRLARGRGGARAPQRAEHAQGARDVQCRPARLVGTGDATRLGPSSLERRARRARASQAGFQALYTGALRPTIECGYTFPPSPPPDVPSPPPPPAPPAAAAAAAATTSVAPPPPPPSPPPRPPSPRGAAASAGLAGRFSRRRRRCPRPLNPTAGVAATRLCPVEGHCEDDATTMAPRPRRRAAGLAAPKLGLGALAAALLAAAARGAKALLRRGVVGTTGTRAPPPGAAAATVPHSEEEEDDEEGVWATTRSVCAAAEAAGVPWRM